jgi:hypothetical protein
MTGERREKYKATARIRTFVDGTVGYNVNGVTELERPDVGRRRGHSVLAERARKFFAGALAKTFVLSHGVGSVLQGDGEINMVITVALGQKRWKLQGCKRADANAS